MGLEGDVDALLFDVFGTVVDWRTSVARQLAGFRPLADTGLDPWELADGWRAAYRPAMERVESGELAWMNLDELHARSFSQLLSERGVSVSAAQARDAALFWHRLDPWPDAVEGLNRLKRHFTIATLSNGNVALLLDIAKRAELPWDTLLSAELARRYKLDLSCYTYNASLIGRPFDRIMMVAAHAADLEQARRAGLRTAFVERPLEHGPPARLTPPHYPVDLRCADFLDLATALGA